MKKIFLFTFDLLCTCMVFNVIFISCNNPSNESQQSKVSPFKDSLSVKDTLKPDTSKEANWVEKVLKEIPKNVKPVFGYRFIIEGDFDGDGKKEKLIEHFFSETENKETNKFYDDLDYDQLVALTMRKYPRSFVLSDNLRIDTLRISSDCQLLGLSFLKNEGDLNGDGNDEISYVVNWADWSNQNTWHVMMYKKNKWQELYSFSIWDWQLPDLPETFNQYGLFGLQDKYINTTNDSVNLILEKQLKEFPGLVKRIKTNKIRVIYKNDEADEDTIVVDLKKIKK